MSIFGSLINIVLISDCSRSSKFSLVVRKMAVDDLVWFRIICSGRENLSRAFTYLGIHRDEGPLDPGTKSKYLCNHDDEKLVQSYFRSP
jgi:hypothetical protein